MIKYLKEKDLFVINTKSTTYVIGLSKTKHLLHLYYGQSLNDIPPLEAFLKEPPLPLGSSTSYEDTDFNLNHVPLEAPTYGKGDYREPMVHLENEAGYRSMDFLYHAHESLKDFTLKDYPKLAKPKTLKITLKEKTFDIYLHLFITPYDEEDIIIRSCALENQSEADIIIDRMLSANLDFLTSNYDLLTLDGAWIKERHMQRHPLRYGVHKIDSKKGVSSSDHNPFFALLKQEAGQTFGDVYGFNLIYSGNFEANIEKNPHDLLRVNLGINSFDFKWHLKPKDTFYTPEALLSFSNQGLNGMRHNMHRFIEKHITKNKQARPIKVNNWEATYFDFKEKDLLKLAKKAQKLGIECFCLDDGWFAKRDDDQSSLGDWVEHKKKLPKGLPHLSNKIKRLGLKFGLWVEPEMVSMASELYKKHPTWVIRHPNIKPSLGRHQLMLDLSKPEVVDYLFDTLYELFHKAQVDYVKWDMNRNISDVFSQHQSRAHQGKLTHLYTLGLYRLLKRLKEAFPHVLFESCASGGNRFDLGMLFYMPQTWTSDNTDSFERLNIHAGTSLPYPISSISNHVSDDISHQVLRHTPLETRFNVACFGLLGYELDLRKRSRFDEKVIKAQIAFYKAHRNLLQYGRFYQLTTEEGFHYMVVSEKKDEAILGVFQGLNPPNPGHQIINVQGLDEDKTYEIENRPQFENLKRFGALVKHAMPIKLKAHGTLFNLLSNHYLFEVERFKTVLKGKTLMHQGLVLPPRFSGTGYHEKMRVMPDFSSRLYVIKEQNHGKA